MKALRTAALVMALIGLAVLGAAAPGQASIQGQMYCWALDAELPVACDEEEEE